ncbi:hypothetical protein [Streptomyces sp. NPDC059076]|uniref:hypothetical protein n=1 Tax=unclassified Streptomyces TaxID=2593676 RepID=UPI0036C30DC8
MSLFPAPILVNGATHSAQTFRMLVRDLARGAEGITEGDDLRVSQLTTPGDGVQIRSGSGIVRGRFSTFQGSYAVCNAGADTVDVAPTGGTARSDMVVVRVEDPEYEGDLNPAVDPICYFEVISNVGSTATTVPGGRSAIPLARIDIPTSTSTITDAMITDLRKIANPRRDRKTYLRFPTSTSASITNSNGVWQTFNTASDWNIDVPDWASQATVRLDILQLKYSVNPFIGQMRGQFGSSLATQPVILDDNQSGIRRQMAAVADTLTIPTAYRGTTQALRAQATGTTGNTGTLAVDASTTLLADVEFIEAPR